MVKTIRCRNTTISANPIGLISGETPVYTWSYEIISGGINKDRWLSEISSIMTLANSNNLQRITVPSTLTEKITDTTNFRFIV